MSRDGARAPSCFHLMGSRGVPGVTASGCPRPTPSDASWPPAQGTLCRGLCLCIWLPARTHRVGSPHVLAGGGGTRDVEVRRCECRNVSPPSSVLGGGLVVFMPGVTCPHTFQHLISFNGGNLMISCFILLSNRSSVDLSAGPGSPTLHPHQSCVSHGGQRAGNVRTAELAVPGRDGQLLAQYGTAAEDAVRASQAGQLLPRSRRGPGQSPGGDRAERGNVRLSRKPRSVAARPMPSAGSGARRAVSTPAYIPHLSGRARLENRLQIKLFS